MIQNTIAIALSPLVLLDKNSDVNDYISDSDPA